jgi:hypothetical protein
MILHGKAKQVAAFCTRAKTPPRLRIWIDDERRCFFVVEWATGFVIATGFVQLDMLLDIAYEVDSTFDFVYD